MPRLLTECWTIVWTSRFPVVLCTTGLSDEQLAKVEECYKKVAVLKSANMSLGINTLMALLKNGCTGFPHRQALDMEIVEKHHNLNA